EITVNDVPYQILFTDWDLRGARVGGMAVALPVDFISGRLNDTRNSFIALFTILVIVIMITGYLIGQSIVRPVFRMVNTTRAIRDGDLSRRVGLRLPDELGELSSSFDHMTDQLVQRNEEISGLYQEQLRETARRTTILESIRDLVIVLDTNAKITLVNDTARAFMQRLSNLNDRKPYRKFWDICRNPQRYSTPVTMQLLDLDVSVQATFIKQEDDNVIGYVVVLRDITSVLEAERLKDEMILQLSHELRTPLAGARGYLELAGMMTGEKQQSYLTRSLNQVDVLGEMVNRVIEVSVMLSGQMRLNIATFNLNTQLQSIIETHRDAIAERNIDLQVQLPDAPTMIDGDEEQLQKAIGNVVENAYRYNFPDGWLLVELELTDEQYVTVLIKDSGRGIDEDEQEKVFERMYRGRSADADETDQRGLGLGLFIAREIVKAHHGRIALRSQIGKGTVVAIRLPIRQPEA
ncbi:MAG: ATP-binding protein, partial [Chloroflexota bacterium]